MTDTDRKLRADSQRNRERLLETAKAVFAGQGADVPLETISREAGVGIATLYRHFPTRPALHTAVYRRELEQLAASAEALLAEREPAEALRAWLHLLLDYLATKRVVAPAIRASGDGEGVFKTAGTTISAALERFRVALAIPDLTADDLYRIVIALSHGYDQPGWEASARRLVDILVAGLTASRGSFGANAPSDMP